MDWLTWFFLESAAALAVGLGLILFWLLVLWRRGGSARPLLIGLLLAIVLLGVQQVVDTPRERAARILAAIERDVIAGRTAALAASLADTFVAAGMDRSRFVEYAREQLQRVRIEWVRRGELVIEPLARDRFLASVGYQAGVIVRDADAGFVPSRWRITFGRTSDGWKITTIDPPTIAGQQFRDWDISP